MGRPKKEAVEETTASETHETDDTMATVVSPEEFTEAEPTEDPHAPAPGNDEVEDRMADATAKGFIGVAPSHKGEQLNG